MDKWRPGVATSTIRAGATFFGNHKSTAVTLPAAGGVDCACRGDSNRVQVASSETAETEKFPTKRIIPIIVTLLIIPSFVVRNKSKGTVARLNFLHPHDFPVSGLAVNFHHIAFMQTHNQPAAFRDLGLPARLIDIKHRGNPERQFAAGHLEHIQMMVFPGDNRAIRRAGLAVVEFDEGLLLLQIAGGECCCPATTRRGFPATRSPMRLRSNPAVPG